MEAQTSGRGGGGGRRGGRRKKRPEQQDAAGAGAAAAASASAVGPSAPAQRRQQASAGMGGGRGKKKTNNNKRGGGRGGRNRGGGGSGGRSPEEIAEAEARARAEAKAKAAALAERKAAEEAAALRRARIEVLQSALEGREAALREAISALGAFSHDCTAHAEHRARFEGLPALRKDFQVRKKSLKSDLKKCTAFVKKVRGNLVWDDPTSPSCPNPTSAPVAAMRRDVAALNLTRYVEEIASAIQEVLASPKTKLGDMPGIAVICAALHERYEEFVPSLLSGMLPVLKSTSPSGEGKANKDSAGSPKHRRVCLRLATEFALLGLLPNGTADVRQYIVKILSEASGAPSSSEAASVGEDEALLYSKYRAQDPSLVASFGKFAGCEILGIVPRSVRNTLAHLEREVTESDRMAAAAAASEEDNEPTPVEEDQGDQSQGGPEVATDVDAIDETEYSTISLPLVDQAKGAMHLARVVVESYPPATDEGGPPLPPSRLAVPPQASTNLRTHLAATHSQLSTALVATHGRLRRLEKRCEEDRLMQGQLSEAREKGLTDARKLVENLTKWVEGLADALNLDVPVLVGGGEDDPDAEEGGGIELVGKGKEDGGDDLGPYDDEETKSFYTDIPDLLSTLPATLLGLTPEMVEKKNAENKLKYAGDGNGVEIAAEEETPTPEALDLEGDAFEDVDEDDANADQANPSGEDQDNKDTPHYRLQVLLEQELPECHNRAQIDAVAEKFCSNHATTKAARKRLSRTLFLVPRVRLDLLPYYARLAAIMDKVFDDISAPLVSELEAQFHGQTRWKKQQNLEGRMKTSRFLGELTKFRVAPPIVVMRALRRCLDDFSGFNIDIVCCLLESCGRYLYRMPHTRKRMTLLLDTIMRIKKAKNLDERSIALINSAMFMVNPPQISASKHAKILSPIEAYLKDLFMVRLTQEASMVSLVSKQVQRLPWSDPTQECGELVVKYMLKACRKGRYKAVGAVAAVAFALKRSKPEVMTRLADTTIEELTWALEHPNLRDHQRTIVHARLLAELHNRCLVSAPTIFDFLYAFINIGHEIPLALRAVSEKWNAESMGDFNAAPGEAPTTFMATSGDVSQIIVEDEEMEGEEGVTPFTEEGPDEANKPPAAVAVSEASTYDPRVPTLLDPPNSPFRITLVCTVLENVLNSSLSNHGHILQPNSASKLAGFLAAFQRYLFTKTTLPSEVEFNLLDLFDGLDSRLRRKTLSKKRRGETTIQSTAGFERYHNWLDAHNATVAMERTRAVNKKRTDARLFGQCGIYSVANTSGLDDVDEHMAVSDEEDDESIDDQASIKSAEDMSIDGDSNDSISSEGSLSDGDSLSDEDSGASCDEEADPQAGAEEEYVRQKEDDAFEREIRRLTADAIEKGKITARSTGGKVSDAMPVASQLVLKRSTVTHDAPPSAASLLPFGINEGMSFQLLKKGHKGRTESKQLFIPTDTNLARTATKQDDEAARERVRLKKQVLRYAAESAQQDERTGGNVYLEQERLKTNRNRPLTMDRIDQEFGASDRRPTAGGGSGRGDGGRGRTGGRGRGFSGRLFNPGSYSRSSREDDDDF